MPPAVRQQRLQTGPALEGDFTFTGSASNAWKATRRLKGTVQKGTVAPGRATLLAASGSCASRRGRTAWYSGRRASVAPEHSCAQASRERLSQAQRRPGRPRSCRHQMHCRRRSTRAARRLIDYGSRVGALCCAVPGSTTPSSRRSPRRGEAQRPTTPGPRRDRRRRDIETSGDLR